jgi:hypothetical protein
MKHTNYLLVLLLMAWMSFSPCSYLNAQSIYPMYEGAVIPITKITVLPETCAAPGNGVDRLTDGVNYGDYTEFHTPWSGMSKQDVVLEAMLDGSGKTLNEVVLEQRYLGLGGILKSGSIWVMSKNQYRKIQDIDCNQTNKPLVIKLKKPIKHPQRIKVVITDAYSDNGNYMVCLGELACIMYEDSAAMLVQEVDTIASKADRDLMLSVKRTFVANNEGKVASYAGDRIRFKELKVSPAGCAVIDNDVDRLTDGKNFGEKTQFHTPWSGMPKQPVAIEAGLEGEGKTLNEVVLDQRFTGTVGLINRGSLWVMLKGKYQKLAELQLTPVNGRLRYRLKVPVLNPEKIKLVIDNTFSDNGEYVVCLGELACVSYTQDGLKMVENERNQLLQLFAKEKENRILVEKGRQRILQAMQYVGLYKGEVLSLNNLNVQPSNCPAPGNGVDKLTDGLNYGDKTLFHTPWTGMEKQDITFEADIDGNGKRLDQIILDQRFMGTLGIIKSATVWVMINGQYQKVEDLDLECSNGRLEVEPRVEIRNPEKIKLVIHDAYTDNGKYVVCLGELACVMLPDSVVTRRIVYNEGKVFADGLGLTLRKGLTKRNLENIKLPILKQYARQLFDKIYHAGNLKMEVQPYQNPSVISEKMNIMSGFSMFEGVTGVVLNKGPNLVFVGKTKGAKLKLLQPNWLRKSREGFNPERDSWDLEYKSYPLNEGINYIDLPRDGLVYVQYFTEDDPKTHAPVIVHFPTGKYNGYFDLTRGDTDADFNALLQHSMYPIVDLKGVYTQAAFPVAALKKYTLNKGLQLIRGYDTIVALHRRFIGWEKQGYNPKNHILSRVNYQSFMYRDKNGVAFIDSMMSEVLDPKVIHNGNQFWGFVHEIGHIFQMRPQLTWGGMVEVSNNIAAMYVMTSLGNGSRLSNEKLYEEARKTILDKNMSYLGYTRLNPNTGRTSVLNTDVFQRAVPFWQLYLYFKSQGKPDFYADVMIAMRNQVRPAISSQKDYLNMLEFCRLACEISGTDLTDFFQRWGFFYVGRLLVEDKVMFDYTITQQEVDATKKAIADMHLPKPKVDISSLED